MTEAVPAREQRLGRRDQILQVAAELFASRGFHGVSIADIGAAVGTSGPALYRHFASKEALLSEILVNISEHLLAGGRARVTPDRDPRDCLEDLVDFHVEFSLDHPELIVVQDRDLANLPAEPRRRVRALQRAYVEIWVSVVSRLSPGLSTEEARVAAHGTFGLLNSTPHSASAADRATVAGVLRTMALTALTTRSTDAADAR